jgi:hypothetical protein
MTTKIVRVGVLIVSILALVVSFLTNVANVHQTVSDVPITGATDVSPQQLIGPGRGRYNASNSTVAVPSPTSHGTTNLVPLVVLPDTTTTTTNQTDFLTPEERAMSNKLDALAVGWQPPKNYNSNNNDTTSTPLHWTEALCPAVVKHFQTFPSFRYASMLLPIQSTEYAVRTVCTFQVAVAVAASINARMYLHAGSHLGALTHGQPIPWDDDADAFLDHDKKQAFYSLCQGDGLRVYPGVSLRCFDFKNAIKVWLYTDGMAKETGSNIPWYSPFLDLFLFQKKDGYLYETHRDGSISPKAVKFAIADYFPTIPYYFGGITIMGPQSIIAEQRYNLTICRIGSWNHRREVHFRRGQKTIDCRQFQNKLPFLTGDTITNGVNTTRIRFFTKSPAVQIDPLTVTSVEQRAAWATSLLPILGRANR